MKIGIIAPYEGMLAMIKNVKTADDVLIISKVATYDHAVDIANEMKEDGVEAIISRGATFHLIERKSSLPTIHCNIGIIDIMYALQEAKQYSNYIGIISFDSFHYAKDLLEDIFKVKICFIEGYESVEENEKQVLFLKKTGISVVIGGSITVKCCERYGLKGVLATTRPETLSQSIEEAIRAVQIVRKNNSTFNNISQIINCTSEAIFLTDLTGKIILMNVMAEDFCKKLTNGHIAKVFDTAWICPEIVSGIMHGESVTNQVYNINDITFIYSQRVIALSDNSTGIVLFFHEDHAVDRLEHKILKYKQTYISDAKYTLDDFIGESQKIAICKKNITVYAKSDSTILLIGESGTGKEIIAQSIHNLSSRSKHPFIAVNCTALSENLLESELFGYTDGSFTGGRKGGKIGLIELAHKGTFFLDEIGSLPMQLQAKLLRVLQEKEIRRIGGENPIPVDVRFIAATNSDLSEKIRHGEFRLDLFYRLCVLKLKIPPLRERKSDILLLTKHFSGSFNLSFNQIPESVINLMLEYEWPGNVRELKNFIEQASILSPLIPIEEIFRSNIMANEEFFNDPEDCVEDQTNRISVRRGTLEEMENEIIQKVYDECNGNKSAAAEKLGISRVTVWNKLSKKQ